jgi:hypothetical protein
MKNVESRNCSFWKNKLAVGHPDDLSPIERNDLNEHMAICPQCAAAHAAFNAVHARLRSLPPTRGRLSLTIPAPSRVRFFTNAFNTAMPMLIIGGMVLVWVFLLSFHHYHSTLTGAIPPPTLPLPTLAPISSATVAATVTPSNSTHLFQSYKGTLQELSTNVPSQMTLTHVLQNGGLISGSFTSTLMRGSFSGHLDSSKHIFFTVANPSGGAPLFFTGTVQSAGNMEGSFCAIDQNNQCISGATFGVWNVVPIR